MVHKCTHLEQITPKWLRYIGLFRVFVYFPYANICNYLAIPKAVIGL